MATAVAPVTFTEFAALPERPGKQELILGEVIAVPPAKLFHMDLVHRIHESLRLLLSASDRRPADAYIETGYQIGSDPGSWLVPDASVRYPDHRRGDYLEGAPMLAVEVVSESNTAEQLDRKIALYLEHGAQEVWAVYASTRSLWQYRDDATARRHTAAFESALFPGRPFPLESIWE
ncbi:MAG: Uma2 family endonuclease [Acidobacteria bacterium]|nr:Uma2 family endonuclease [Acidobacteriota bacterium]